LSRQEQACTQVVDISLCQADSTFRTSYTLPFTCSLVLGFYGKAND
jgi:hypothetical protein